MTKGRKPDFVLSAEQIAQAATKCRLYRKTHDLTQAQLARALACREVDISYVERGSNRRASRVAQAILNLPE